MLLLNDIWVVPYNPTKTIGEYRNKSNQTNTDQSQRGAPRCSHRTFPLGKVLEMLKNFFQEVFKQGLGQRPKVLGSGAAPQGLKK